MARRNCANGTFAEVNNAVNGIAGGSNTWTGSKAPSGTIIAIPAGSWTWAEGELLVIGTTTVGVNLFLLGGCSNNSGGPQTYNPSAIGPGPTPTIITGASILPGAKRVTIKFQTLQDTDGGVPTCELSGFEFRGTAGQAHVSNGDYIISGNCHNVRVHHNHFNLVNGIALALNGSVRGCVDHNDFDVNSDHPIIINNGDSWDNSDQGNGSWEDAPNWGGPKFMFIEDNDFHNDGFKDSLDSFNGARYVSRYNNCHNIGLVLHGSEGQGRGGCKVEEYYNVYESSLAGGGANLQAAGQIRSGSLLSHHNSWTGYSSGHDLQAFRLYKASIHWGQVSGHNLYDQNVPCPTQIGSSHLGCWATGTHTGSNQSATLVDSNAGKLWRGETGDPLYLVDGPDYGNADPAGISDTSHVGAWEVNHWSEDGYVYMVRNRTKEAGRIDGSIPNPYKLVDDDANPLTPPVPDTSPDPKLLNYIHRWALSNTTTAITLSTQSFQSTDYNPKWDFGDVYEIWKVRRALDQGGSGASSELHGLGNSPLTPTVQMHQRTEATHSWSQNKDFESTQPQMKLNFDYFTSADATAAKAGYSPYPHPHHFVSGGVVPTQIISLSGAMNFGNQVIGAHPTLIATITNTGNTAFTVTSVAISGSVFAVSPTGSPSFNVAPLQTINLTVTFSPIAAATYAETLTVTSDADNAENTIALSGKGVVGTPAQYPRYKRAIVVSARQ